MPYLHGTTEWRALQYIVPQSTPPETMVKTFAKAELAWILVGGDPAPFWEGAIIDNPSWRAKNIGAVVPGTKGGAEQERRRRGFHCNAETYTLGPARHDSGRPE